jgi:REP element-mobilizing transposase RayT
VTFNTHRRRRLLANERVHERFVAFGKAGLARGIAIGRYVIMPDHIHLFVGGSLDFVLVQWMRILKRSLSGAIHEAAPHWQSGFFDNRRGLPRAVSLLKKGLAPLHLNRIRIWHFNLPE